MPMRRLLVGLAAGLLLGATPALARSLTARSQDFVLVPSAHAKCYVDRTALLCHGEQTSSRGLEVLIEPSRVTVARNGHVITTYKR